MWKNAKTLLWFSWVFGSNRSLVKVKMMGSVFRATIQRTKCSVSALQRTHGFQAFGPRCFSTEAEQPPQPQDSTTPTPPFFETDNSGTLPFYAFVLFVPFLLCVVWSSILLLCFYEMLFLIIIGLWNRVHYEGKKFGCCFCCVISSVIKYSIMAESHCGMADIPP